MSRQHAVQQIIIPKTSDIGDHMQVRRVLPSRQRRMVGPFIFLDEMGPRVFAPGRGLDVAPHPHTGLATVTYLYSGEIVHRDSLGSVQTIRPREVNWMTAGSGIVHSERTTPEARAKQQTLHGLQSWVALPQRFEQIAPSFHHHPADRLPCLEAEGATARVIAGSFFGATSPVSTLSALFYVDLHLATGAKSSIPAEYPEQALYIVEGCLAVEHAGVFEAGQLLVIKRGQPITISAPATSTRVMLLGGEPMDGPRAVLWNFVGSSAELLQQAEQDWRNQRFPNIPGENDYIPMPDLGGKPVFYP